MKNFFGGLLLCLIANSAAANNDYPITYVICSGFHLETQKYWQIQGESQEGERAKDEAPQIFQLVISNLTGEKPVQTVARRVVGTRYKDVFRIVFYKNDDASSPMNIEGVLTVENTKGFPAVTRFVAHGWLASNPMLSTSAFDFSCELN